MKMLSSYNQIRNVLISDSVVSKQYAKDQFKAELTKAQLLASMHESSTFVFPKILGTDYETSTIHYEVVDCSTSLLDIIGDSKVEKSRLLNYLRLTGACLGEIHALPLPSEVVAKSRADLFSDALTSFGAADRVTKSTSQACVLQHGDFGITNVHFGTDGRPIIIDPSPNQYLSIHPLNADIRELDFAILLAPFIGRASSATALARCVFSGREMVNAIIEGYQNVSNVTLDRSILRTYTLAGIKAYQRYSQIHHYSRIKRKKLLNSLSYILRNNI